MKKILIAVVTMLSIGAGCILANQWAFNEGANLGTVEDLTTPSSLQKYMLGQVVSVYDDTKLMVKRFKYYKAPRQLTAYKVYITTQSSVSGAEVACDSASIRTTDITNVEVVIPQVSVPAGYYFWGQISGNCTVIATTNTTVGQMGDVIASANTMSANGVILTTSTAGSFTASRYGTGSVGFHLWGRRTGIDALK